MSNTIAHRPHVHHHVSPTPVVALLVAVAIAAVVIWGINQPQSTVTTGVTQTLSAPVPEAAPVAAPESPVFRHTQMRVLESGGYPRAYITGHLHHVEGSMLDPLTTVPAAGSGERRPGSFQAPR